MPSGHCQAAPEPFCLPRAAHPRARTSGNYEPRQNSDRTTTTGTDIDLRPIICMLIVQEFLDENSDDSNDGDDDDDDDDDDDEEEDDDDDENYNDILFVLDVLTYFLTLISSNDSRDHEHDQNFFNRFQTRKKLKLEDRGGDALLSRDKGKCGGKIAEERRGAGTRGSGLDVGGWKRAKRERMRWRRKSRKRRKRRRGGGGGGGGGSGGWKVGERDKAEWKVPYSRRKWIVVTIGDADGENVERKKTA
ncbi:hypothetical protein HZH66_001419 [Vespula vulgaris]|uniref:Uncharacterized protein n=1 Tax=Vespula vulgaris TaxID=7454 RepID=A0A834KTE0_VESVU|nr:hypothetical protein HZH66_001419 [Vespula vulgaris]